MFINILAALALVLHVAIAAVLIRKYLLTRDVGFVWLGVAVVVWPIVSGFLSYGRGVLIDRLSDGKSVGFYPFTLVEHGQMTLGALVASLGAIQQIIGVCLLLIAILYLSKTKSDSKLQPTA